MNSRRLSAWIFFCLVAGVGCGARGQTMLKVTSGWGDAMRLGRWTPVFLSVADPVTRDVDLQIHGSYGEKSLALLVHQTAVISPRPTTYALIYPLNAQPSRIEVIVSDLKTGRTLATAALQNPAGFSPAGKVPKRLLGPQDFLVGVSGEIGGALRLQGQLDRAGLVAGILNPIRLPANFVGYDGITVLVLVAADFSELKSEQELAILRWVEGGGVLLVIPGTGAFPTRGVLADALPCDVGMNRAIANLNGRELVARPGAVALRVLDQNAYEKRQGLGHIAVLPMDISSVTFSDAQKGNDFWRGVLDVMTKVPEIERTTEMPLSDEEDILIAGPNAGDSVGRGQRETVAIRHVLELLGGSGSERGVDWRKIFLVFAGLFFLAGPVDSVLLMRLGQRPRNWVTVVGWVGLIACGAAYGASWRGGGAATASSFRLVDQVNGVVVGATDVVAVKSERSESVRLDLDEDEWWEPANQADRSFGVDRFVDARSREDRRGCRPEVIRLTGGEAQAWHGEVSPGGAGILLGAKLALRSGAGGMRLVGTITNLGKGVLRDIQVETGAGDFLVGGEVDGGKTTDVDVLVSGKGIGFGGLPGDVLDVSPGRGDGVEALVKGGGVGCVYCLVGDGAGGMKGGDGVEVGKHWEVLRAVVGLGE
jgi:hypothetical protein